MTAPVVAATAVQAVEDCAEVLAAWASEPSGSHDRAGLAAMADRVVERAETLPVDVRRVVLQEGAPDVLVWSCRPQAPRRVLLVGHYDTVHGPDLAGPPVEVRDATMTGPGVADMKGGILVMLAALTGFEASPVAGGLGWDLILTPDEELGAPISREFLVRSAAGMEAGLVFEPAPAGGGVVIARRGRSVLRCTATGRSAHAGRDPRLGRNAVTALAEFVLAAERLSDPGRGTDVTVSLFTGGSVVNAVPEHAEAVLDVRAAGAAAFTIVRGALAVQADGLNVRREVRVDVDELFGCPPMTPTLASKRLATAYGVCMAAVGGVAVPEPVGGVSDGNHLAGAGLDVLDGLGPEGGGLHGPDEWVDLDSVPRRAAAAAMLLHRIAGGDRRG